MQCPDDILDSFSMLSSMLDILPLVYEHIGLFFHFVSNVMTFYSKEIKHLLFSIADVFPQTSRQLLVFKGMPWLKNLVSDTSTEEKSGRDFRDVNYMLIICIISTQTPKIDLSICVTQVWTEGLSLCNFWTYSPTKIQYGLMRMKAIHLHF